ncbi:MAG TPA: electron transfer flavoprotein subunit alpha/FixB family protein, partial [Thermoanaerobaculia bacterium]
MPNVLVFCDLNDGKLKKASREALSIGRTLAASAGGDLFAFACGSAGAALAGDVGKYGAKRLLVASDAQFDAYQSETCTAAAKTAVDAAQAGVIVLPGTSNGRDLAPRLAARLDAGVASDAVSLEWTDGKLRARRLLYSGRVIATVEIDSTPAIATCRPNAFPPAETGGGAAEVANLDVQVGETKSRLVEVNVPEVGEISIAEAEIIVSGGRGL